MIRAPACRLGEPRHDFDEIDSTQQALAELARAGAPEGTVVTARHQHAGRGRRGNSWWDRPGESLLWSVLLRPGGRLARAPELSLVAGLAVAEGLDAAGVSAAIKWPNDLLVDGKKVAGVLAEAVAGPDAAVQHVLLGIGVNVAQTSFPAPLGEVATSLRLATGRDHAPESLLSPLLERLSARYAEWRAAGLDGLLDAWCRRAVTVGASVATPGGGIGVATGVAGDGALLVRRPDGEIVRLMAPADAGPA